MGLRKHHNKQIKWRLWNSRAISNPKTRCCESATLNIASKFGKLSSGHRTRKGQFSFQFQRKAMPKSVHTTAQLHSSQMLAKKYSKFSKPGSNSTWTVNFQIFKMDLEKAAQLEIKLPTSVGWQKKQEGSSKTSTSALLTTPKPWAVWVTTNCGKFFKRWEYYTTLPASWEICRQVKKQQLEPDMEQHTGSNLRKDYVKAVYCHPAYLTYMHHEKRWAGWSTSLDKDCREK